MEYDGTEFCGFQWQPAVRTVGGVVEAALTSLFEEPIKIAAAGRTDSGVHATGQVVSFSTQREFELDRLVPALNALLPPDCSVREASAAQRGFSARFSACERTYVYAIVNGAARGALLARYAYHVLRPLDVVAMRAAAAPLIGEHDFRCFGTVEPGQTPVRLVTRLTAEPRGALLRIEITANAFLHHMVRAVVGTLVECGDGRREPEGIPALLAAATRPAGATLAPARGLYFAGVRYDDGYDSFAEPPLFAAVP